MRSETVRRLVALGAQITLASAPFACVVCDGDDQWIPCPHCLGELPIAHFPMRDDSPRTGSAA